MAKSNAERSEKAAAKRKSGCIACPVRAKLLLN